MKTALRPQLKHIGIFVHDVEAMKEFYAALFGLEVNDEATRHDGVRLVFMSSDPDEHHQLLLVSGRDGSSDVKVINQISFRLSTLSELQQFHQTLVQRQLTIERTVTHGNSWSLYFRDPEGNPIEVYSPSAWHINQPFGEHIDLTAASSQVEARTRGLIEGDESLRTAEEFRAEFRRRLASS